MSGMTNQFVAEDCLPGLFPSHGNSNEGVEHAVSSLFGWAYFICWSVCFYPQIILNYKRKSVVGFHFDFLCLNVIGYISYVFYNTVLFYSHKAQEEYCWQKGPPNPVHANDLLFAWHGLCMVCVLVWQCANYERGKQKVTYYGLSIGAVLWAWVMGCLFLGGMGRYSLLETIEKVSLAKLGASFFKYFPQLYFNYQRKSTAGWSIRYVMLDFTGGVLSLIQEIFDFLSSGNSGVVSGDPVKFGLNMVAIGFGALFFLQHFYLYPPKTLSESV